MSRFTSWLYRLSRAGRVERCDALALAIASGPMLWLALQAPDAAPVSLCCALDRALGAEPTTVRPGAGDGAGAALDALLGERRLTLVPRAGAGRAPDRIIVRLRDRRLAALVRLEALARLLEDQRIYAERGGERVELTDVLRAFLEARRREE